MENHVQIKFTIVTDQLLNNPSLSLHLGFKVAIPERTAEYYSVIRNKQSSKEDKVKATHNMVMLAISESAKNCIPMIVGDYTLTIKVDDNRMLQSKDTQSE